MEYQAQLNQELFQLGSVTVRLSQLLEIVGVIGFLFFLGYMLLNKWLPMFYAREDTSSKLRPRARRLILWVIVLLSVITILRVLNIDYQLWPFDDQRFSRVTVRISNLVTALLLLSTASLVDWIFDEILLQYSHRKAIRSGEEVKHRSFRSNEPVIYTLVAVIISNDIGLSELDPLFGAGGDTVRITIGGLLLGLLMFFLVRMIWQIILEIGLSRYYQRAGIDQGTSHALTQLLTYFVYVIGVLWMLTLAGFNLFALWTGAAALLVGIGIGLQQTFNDLICGIIILFERSVKVGDVVDMGGQERVGTVRKIGARTSHVETRDGILMYVPNSKLIGERVVNWSQTEHKARFHVAVGVAYGSDTELVKKILLDVANKHPRVMKLPAPRVRFMDFGNSSLDFDLLIYTRDFIGVEDVKSDLRFAIDAAFREKNIEIPFPQRDIWIRGDASKGTDN